ncbi:group 1 truncated hemoglobin [Moritella sp. 24]|uniref:group I truncated hemoglobin n=1 Tax=Moritella sp. 24 TaxID=2746230 RepID=UPI001BA92C6B|nr:group 1 truncated hemoglobin [Moritella sp. 24]QUM76356.1 group 1 truncated hemoglobin [Moritella sp. 24]
MRTVLGLFLFVASVIFTSNVNALEGTGHNNSDNSLYVRLGGLMPITVVVNDFVDVVINDVELNKNPAINASRARVPKTYLKFQVATLVCQVTKGPCVYKGREMKDAHKHLQITEKEWYRMIVLFKEVLAKHKVSAMETHDLLAILESTKADIVTVK